MSAQQTSEPNYQMDLPRLCVAIADYAPLPMATLDGEKHIIRYGNPAFCRLLNKPLDELLGKSLDNLLPNKDVCLKLMKRVYNSKKPETYTEQDLSIPYPVFWSYTIWPVVAEEGLVSVMIQVIESGRDHENTVALNEALMIASVRQHELTEAAENRNVQFLAELNERKQADQLKENLLARERIARVRVEDASRAKDQFLAMLSHELRTPLNSIIGWAQYLSEGSPDASELAKGLATIERSAKAQTALIEDLLDMSRIISGKLRLQVEETDLGEVVQAALTTLLHSADAKHIEIDSHVEPAANRVTADPVRLQQVVWNLFSNAIKFTPPHGKVQFRATRDKDHIEMRITDTGQGIKPDFIPHVFERFRQADASSTRRSGGLGLGLSICKDIVALHGGSISVSSPGESQGTTFTVRLPVVARSTVETPAEPKLRASNNASLQGVRILVVDDDPDAVELLRRLLQKQAAIVDIAFSADEALKVMESCRFDLIICDIGMPNKDGYELIRETRSSHLSSRNAPAIAVTAFAHPEDRMRALQAGYNLHIAKPVDNRELLAVVSGLVRN